MSADMSDGKPEQPATLQVSESGEVKLEMPATPQEASPQGPPQDRDPNGMNEHVKVKFEDLFAEPDPEIHSIDQVWGLTSKVFTLTKFWCYRVTSVVLALPLAVCWGVYFACVAFCSVWCCIPCLRLEEIKFHCLRKVWALTINTFVAPCFDAIGRCFANIKVTSRSE